MKIEEAEKFAIEKFDGMDEMKKEMNLIHVECMIQAIREMVEGEDLDVDKLIALAWVHDVGKVEKDDSSHPEVSVEILEKEGFELDETDKDCILNHGSSKSPTTKEGIIFRACDGLAVLSPKSMMYWAWGSSKEGIGFEDLLRMQEKTYKKYLEAYSDMPNVVEKLNERYGKFIE